MLGRLRDLQYIFAVTSGSPSMLYNAQCTYTLIPLLQVVSGHTFSKIKIDAKLLFYTFADAVFISV